MHQFQSHRHAISKLSRTCECHKWMSWNVCWIRPVRKCLLGNSGCIYSQHKKMHLFLLMRLNDCILRHMNFLFTPMQWFSYFWHSSPSKKKCLWLPSTTILTNVKRRCCCSPECSSKTPQRFESQKVHWKFLSVTLTWCKI